MRSRVLLLAVFISLVECKKFGSGGKLGKSHTYPRSYGKSGNNNNQHHGYPGSTGLSGSGSGHAYSPPRQNYQYSPPRQVHYGATSYPVYHGHPPTYVYNYRSSGSKLNMLLTGLALYNLGRMTSHHSHYGSDYQYRSRNNEVCKLGVKKHSEYEESKVDCNLLSSFILDAEIEEGKEDSKVEEDNEVHDFNSTDVSDAIHLKGPSIDVTPDMECFMIHSTASHTSRKVIPCAVLQEYARTSMRVSSSYKTSPMLVWTVVAAFIVSFISSDVCFR